MSHDHIRYGGWPCCGSLHDGSQLAAAQEGATTGQTEDVYCGYNIGGNAQGRGWSVEVHPNTPDLPILRNAVFRVIHPSWMEAVGEARLRLDAMLR
jgi:hypothetical protein